jgi:hypothetical protein
MIYNAVRISEATMRGVGDIIFSAWFFLYLFAERIREAAMAMGRTGVWEHNMIDITIRELRRVQLRQVEKYMSLAARVWA